MSSNWREQYFAALGARDEVEKANEDVYDSYTRLADRLASFSNQGSDGAAVQTKQLHEKEDVGQNTKQKDAQRQASGGATEDVVGALRADLAQAQRSRADLQRRLAKVNEELELSREGARKSSKKVELLTGERNTLSRRLKDRDEELKGKAKLLDDVQSEVVSLDLQLNMAEDRAARLEKENKELVDRWMSRKKKEADAMNKASDF